MFARGRGDASDPYSQMVTRGNLTNYVAGLGGRGGREGRNGRGGLEGRAHG